MANENRPARAVGGSAITVERFIAFGICARCRSASALDTGRVADHYRDDVPGRPSSASLIGQRHRRQMNTPQRDPSPAVGGRTPMGRPRDLARDRTTLSLLLYAVVAIVLVSGCAHQREPAAAPGASSPAASPWALPTSTMRWNEDACELIARNQIGQVPAARTLAYMNLAINNAIVAARQQGRASDGAAAGGAARGPRTHFPKDEQAIVSRLSGEISALGTDGPRADFEAGVA